jgi:hypothetical protein
MDTGADLCVYPRNKARINTVIEESMGVQDGNYDLAATTVR